MESLDSTLECARCGVYYVQRRNLGNLQCTFHPGNVTFDGTISIAPNCYTCCNRSTRVNRHGRETNGCTACDHICSVNDVSNAAAAFDVDEALQEFGPDFDQRPGVILDRARHEYIVFKSRADMLM